MPSMTTSRAAGGRTDRRTDRRDVDGRDVAEAGIENRRGLRVDVAHRDVDRTGDRARTVADVSRAGGRLDDDLAEFDGEDLASAAPKSTCTGAWKPSPKSVTRVPPVTGPEFGVAVEMRGVSCSLRNVKASASVGPLLAHRAGLRDHDDVADELLARAEIHARGEHFDLRLGRRNDERLDRQRRRRRRTARAPEP